MDCSLPGSSVPWDSPGKITRVRLPFPSPGNLPDPGIKALSLSLLLGQADSLPLASQRLNNSYGGQALSSCTVSSRLCWNLTRRKEQSHDAGKLVKQIASCRFWKALLQERTAFLQ